MVRKCVVRKCVVRKCVLQSAIRNPQSAIQKRDTQSAIRLTTPRGDSSVVDATGQQDQLASDMVDTIRDLLVAHTVDVGCEFEQHGQLGC